MKYAAATVKVFSVKVSLNQGSTLNSGLFDNVISRLTNYICETSPWKKYLQIILCCAVKKGKQYKLAWRSGEMLWIEEKSKSIEVKLLVK